MAYVLNPWEDEDKWLPEVDPARPQGPLMASANMSPAINAASTPPFMPPRPMPAPLPPPPPIAPVGPSRGPTSLDALADLERQRPLQSDPQYQPSKKRSILGAIAGIGTGAAAGYLNAGGRVRVDSSVGGQLGDAIRNSKYNKAARDFEAKRTAVTASAQIERERENDRRKAAESDARIKSENAQEEAAKAARARAERPPNPARPFEHDTAKDLIEPGTNKVLIPGTPKATTPKPRNWVTKAIEIRESNAPPEEQDRLIKQLEEDYRRFNPEKGAVKFVTDENGNVSAVKVTASEVAAAPGGVKKLGHIGTARAPRSNQSAANAATRTAADEAALKLITDKAGDHDAAEAAAPSMAIRKAIQEDRKRKKQGAASSKQTKGQAALAQFGINVTPKAGASPPAAPTATAPKAAYKVGDIVERGGKKYRVKAVRPDGKLDADPI